MTQTDLRQKVQVWVFGENSAGERQVLILKMKPERGGFWQPVTGSVEAGETLAQAALRELHEETGITAGVSSGAVLPLGYEFEFNSQRDGNPIQFHETCFAVELDSSEVGKPVRLDSNEHVEFKWVNEAVAARELHHYSNRQALTLLKTRAPDFELKDLDGKVFRLSTAIQKAPVVLVFYPGDFTPVCTKQLCSYRDNWKEFEGTGVQLVGLSPDSESKHTEFQNKFSFPFPLLADPEKKVFKKYGVSSKIMFGMTGRGNILIDSNLRIAFRDVEWTPVTFQGASSLLEAIRKFRQS